MLLMHALFVFLLSSSAMVAPVQGSDTEPPKPLETKQMFHFYGGGPLGYEASLFYMRKLHGFWRTVNIPLFLTSCEPHTLPCRKSGERKL